MRDRAGIYGVLGHADGSVDHVFPDETVKAGDTSFDAFTLGGYFTRTGPTDWYVDAVLQFTWYNIEMTSSRGLGSVDTDAWGMAASIEGGYPYPLRDGWAVEPRAQLVYQTLDIDDFEDIAAEVKYEDTDSLAGRIGARVFREWEDTGADGEVQPRSVWGRVNLWSDLTGEPTTTFSAAGGPVAFESELDQSWAEFEVGADFQNGNGWSVYGDVAYQVTFDGDADSIGGEIGLKLSW